MRVFSSRKFFFFLAGLSSWAPLEDCGHDLNSEVEPLVPGGLKLFDSSSGPAALVLRTPRYPTAHANEAVDLAPSGGPGPGAPSRFTAAPTY